MNLDPEAAPRVGLADLWREFKRLRQEVGFLRSAQGVLAAATIGRGGLVVEDGGAITLLGGSLAVQGGGSVTVLGGGEVINTYPAGQVAARFGPKPWTTYDASGFNPLPSTAYGYFVTDESGANIFQALRTQPDANQPNGYSEVSVGVQSPKNVDKFKAYASTFMDLESAGGANLVAARLSITGGEYVRIEGYTSNLDLDGSGVTITASNTASAANVYITLGGLLQRVGSARALKVDIGDLAPGTADALLALTPHRFRDKAQAEDDPDGAPFILGFIADEVDAAGLTDLVTYDENGEPVAVAYDRITAPLVALVQQQQAQIDDLAAQVQALTARLDALSV